MSVYNPGMYRYALTELFAREGINNPYQLQVRLGITYTGAKRLFDKSQGEHCMTLNTINKICTAFNCAPGDLYAPEGQAKKRARKK